MKTSDFEQKFTAWLDGKLPAAEAAAFEKELETQGFDPAEEKRQADGLGALLRGYGATPPMRNVEFFNHQLMERIARETRAGERQAAPAARGESTSWWRWPRLVFAGACSLAVAGALFATLIPRGMPNDTSPYYATVVDARTFDPSISASTVYDPQSNVTVLWLDGLDYLPADYALQ